VNAGNALKYSAINPRHEIRILILEPGTERDRINCNPVHASLTDRPYEALSYEWDFQQEGEREIILDGFSRRIGELWRKNGVPQLRKSLVRWMPE